MPFMEEELGAAFALHRLPKDGRDAFIAAVGPRVRAIATAGGAPVNGELLAKLPKLEIVANFGVGYDSVDAKAAAARGVVVTNTPDVLTDEVADLAVALLLATVRELPQRRPVSARGQMAGAAVPLLRHAARPHHRHSRPWPHRPGDRAPPRAVRAAHRLSQPQTRCRACRGGTIRISSPWPVT